MTARLRNSAIALVAILVATLVATTLPALAAPPRGTAQITSSRTVLAGELAQPFDVQACNPAEGADSQVVSFVSVFPPPDMFAGGVTPRPPTGWSASVLAGGARILYHGGSMLPGQCLVFGLNANVARPAADQTRTWGVSASADGLTSTTYDPAAAGALTVAFPVLKVTQVSITAPTRATDNTVTAGQTPKVTMKVVNRANAPLAVTPTITGTNTSSVCPGRTLSQTPNVANGDTIHDVVCDTTFAATAGGSTTVLTADATSGASNAIDATSASITIQKAVDLVYQANTMTPIAINPDGSTPYEFKATFKNLGAVTAENLVAAGTELVFTKGAETFRAKLKSPETVPPTPSSGAGSNGTQLTFETITVPSSITDGVYNAAVNFAGIDTNDLGLSVSKALNTLLVDRLAPVVNNLRLVLPDSLVAGEDKAAGSGRVLGFSGDVLKGGALCTSGCTITSASVKQYKAGAENGSIALNGNQIKIEGGKITGSISPSLAAGTDQVELVVTVKHLAPQTTTAASPRELADTVAPRSASASTVGTAGQTNRTIVVTLSERVAWPGNGNNGPTPTQWSVQDNFVSAVSLSDSKGVGRNTDGTPIGDTITLTVERPLREDETPGVQFRVLPASGASSRPFDRVDLKLAENLVTAADGILPGIPVIDTVNGRASQQDDENDTSKRAFFTNEDAMRFRITQVTVGHRVVIRDTVTGQELAAGDVQEPLVPGSAPSITLTWDPDGRPETRFSVAAQAFDATSNPSGRKAENVEFDFTAPALASVIQGNGNDVLIAFSEPILEGRNSALDWTVTGGPDGNETNAFNVGHVTGFWKNRVLTLDDFRYTREGTQLNSVYYEFFQAGGPSGGRYVDRAGNTLGDGIRAAA